MRFARLLTLCLLALPAGVLAARVEIPLRVSLEAVEQVLAEQLVYREGACRYLVLDKPKLEAVGGRLRLSGPGSGVVGIDLAGKCQAAGAWRASVDITFVPVLDRAGRLRVRIVDSKLIGAPVLMWDAAKRHAHARLQRFSVDLAAPRETLRRFLRTLGPQTEAATLETALSQVELLQPRVEAHAVVVPMSLEVPDAWLIAPAAPVSTAPLTEAELEALDNALQPWDAFLAYAIKQLALDHQDAAVRERLFTLLLQGRYDLAAILSGEARTAGDPVRALFIDAWSEMRAIIADARYRLFLDAGDALLALDSAAPGLGVRLSAEGLRQMARSLSPGASGDPLAHDWAVDPQLGELFGVESIPLPQPSAPPGRSWLDFFITRAIAAEPTALDPWVPTRAELAAYEARIGSLLRKTATAQLQRGSLSAPYDGVYRSLVPATALIESCWRQYEQRAGKVRYVRSAASSVGIMQINERVWRGFYDVQRLRWDTEYNARAGAQILMRYLKDYAIPYAERSGNPGDAPRAAYAVYNAGPRAVGRFHKDPPHPREQRVDDRLWTIFQGIASGGQADLRTCAVTSATAER